MATFRLIVYEVLDEIKSVNGDSYITEEHIIFLANQYRLFLILLKLEKEKQLDLSSSNQLTICLDLEETNAIPDFPCEGRYLKSVLEIPALISGTTPTVYPQDYFMTNIAYITKDRMKYVGYNKFLLNIIYCCLLDDHLYFKSQNPLFIYMDKVKLTGVFEDAEEAAKLSCEDSEENCIDFLDKEFPMSGDMIPLMILMLVQLFYQALNRPADNINNSADDIADLVQYIRRNLKSDIAKQITE